ncbi:MAG TPA: UXX-star (seleno)protein family 1 [Anaeromyxobacteraceae bacterium]|nr:UXX-star (seleno)protein family 1 [Anaeromyxobacteraceae bacterium]
MAELVEIFGKDTCPYTNAAREELASRGLEVRFFDVKKDPAAMKRFLELGSGQRRVPLILQGGRVTVGHGGS